MGRKKNKEIYAEIYVHDENLREHGPEGLSLQPKCGAYRIVTGKHTEKGVVLLVDIVPMKEKPKKPWRYHVKLFTDDWRVIDWYGSDDHGKTYKTAEEAKKAFLNDYERWLKTIPSVKCYPE